MTKHVFLGYNAEMKIACKKLKGQKCSLSCRRQSPVVIGPPGLSAAAILGPPLVPSIFSLEFEMGIRFHSLFMDISLLGGNLNTTEYPLALQIVA